MSAACSDGTNAGSALQPNAPEVARTASITIEFPGNTGDILRMSKMVPRMTGRVDTATPIAVTDSVSQSSVPARNARDAPAGKSRWSTKTPDDTRVDVEFTRAAAGAPFSRVEVRTGGKLLYVAESEWGREGERYVLLGRNYERYAPTGTAIRSNVSFRQASPTIRADWTSTITPTSNISRALAAGPTIAPRVASSRIDDEGCDDGGGVLSSGAIQNRFNEELTCAAGCTLKFVAMTAAAAAATVFVSAGAIGLLGTVASGGILLPAEAALVAGYLTAEGVFLDRLDAWLNCTATAK